jgi:hypothetical protein
MALLGLSLSQRLVAGVINATVKAWDVPGAAIVGDLVAFGKLVTGQSSMKMLHREAAFMCERGRPPGEKVREGEGKKKNRHRHYLNPSPFDTHDLFLSIREPWPLSHPTFQSVP